MLLEERFGKSDLLINTHMNCLLSISPLKSSHDLKSFRKFFDHCQIEIRSFETLGVTSDTYGKLLCPLLLKLPSNLVLEYNKLNSEFVLQNLMDFLGKELNSREKSERQQTEVRGNPRLDRNIDSGMSYNTPIASPSTAAELINHSRKPGKGSVYCTFCSGDHLSSDCSEAIRYSLERKKQICFKHGACFKCVKSNHLARFCRSKVLCSKCVGLHAFVMCDSPHGLAINKNKEPDELKQEGKKECSLANSSCGPLVIL
ncbi:DUF1758 domain-containing protein [Trichonephila clavata]|uniref:DUF1758 domain-containing protein n=1 Tax=Trichonephila clavata TaxID=2740835 RepID=A0A8X6JDA8_TRICU|nr:DUF1758 domain-containing protein [Trichonephila clavata]